ncbi:MULTISPECIES: oxidoreductase [Nocardia]|uniref:oxidoreductase n=1 Tax=Nocardia TaxID=1817 RepID=UPI000BEFA158|nr:MULTISPECIES: oxidoreductase [Nocardia]MBF6186509.1 oxidoreductase [Nocardia farcinica]MBF6313796.1 oxidoreductase [Nocardia farcinica]MBF6409229.1 oxidoreductase [Nocardia farcinica]PEH74844.1 oxidoreductase [Nocardia sp. FDAARGOS_372]UEX24363.1 oxidoreductase [Nocardia farcinica]
MGLLGRLRGAVSRGGGTGPRAEDARYLAEWVRTHTGVEGFVEPKTTVTDVTVVLVAADGEWTRRVVGEAGAHRLASDLRIPVYDVAKTGYPQRMRDYDERRRIERRRALEDELRDL